MTKYKAKTWGVRRATAYLADDADAARRGMHAYHHPRPVILATGRGDCRLTPAAARRVAAELVAAADAAGGEK